MPAPSINENNCRNNAETDVYCFLVMAQKKPFVLRLDPDVLKAMEKWAADEFRSTNGQLEWLVTKALKEAGRLKNKKDN